MHPRISVIACLSSLGDVFLSLTQSNTNEQQDSYDSLISMDHGHTHALGASQSHMLTGSHNMHHAQKSTSDLKHGKVESVSRVIMNCCAAAWDGEDNSWGCC